MKKLYFAMSLIFFGIFTYNSNAASFVLNKYDSLVVGAADEQVPAHAQLANPTLNKIEIESYIKVVKITMGHQYSACDASGECGPLTDQDFKPDNTFFIEPASNTGNFINFYMFGNDVMGEDILNVKYWVKGNESDFIEFNIKYSIGLSSVEVVQNNSSFASFAMPSIANNDLKIKIDQILDNASIEVFNSMGNKVYTNSFNGDMIDLNTSDLSQGSYFYNIIKDGSIVSRNNFVVIK